MEPGAHLRGQRTQLVDRGGPVDVATDHHDLLRVLAGQVPRQLGGGRGLARALQTGQQNHHRRWRVQVESLVYFAHDPDQFIVDDLNQGLPGRQALEHLLAQRPFFHLRDEGLNHGQCHIRLQQGDSHFPQGFADGIFAEPSLAAQFLQGMAQPVGKV